MARGTSRLRQVFESPSVHGTSNITKNDLLTTGAFSANTATKSTPGVAGPTDGAVTESPRPVADLVSTNRPKHGIDRIRFVGCITTESVIFLPRLKIDPETGDFDSPSTPRRAVKKLTADQRTDVRRLAATQSLRDLALTFGVCHETIRAVLRSTPVEPMAAD